MQKTYPVDFPNLPRLAQLNSFYCGPAVLQMLGAFLGKQITQPEIVKAAQVEHKIKFHGMMIEELGLALRILAPELRFWFKYQATLGELSQLINFYKIPVGVEWQGIFDYPDEDKYDDEDDDPGHISIITCLDTKNNLIKIADPDRHYAGKDRRFSVLQFERRWWDINQMFDPLTRENRQQDDYHAMFIVTPASVIFPEQLGMM